MISKRLKKISEFVLDNSYLLDVGTDHAYLPIYLAKTRKIYSIASDISPDAFNSALKNVLNNQVEDLVKVLNVKDLEGLNDKVDTITISGLGGKTIINILKSKSLKHIKRLILSPQSDVQLVREKIVELGFKIVDEQVIYDKKYYVVIVFEPGKEIYSLLDLMYGPFIRTTKLKENEDYLKYLIKKVNKKPGNNIKLKEVVKY